MNTPSSPDPTRLYPTGQDVGLRFEENSEPSQSAPWHQSGRVHPDRFQSACAHQVRKLATVCAHAASPRCILFSGRSRPSHHTPQNLTRTPRCIYIGLELCFRLVDASERVRGNVFKSCTQGPQLTMCTRHQCSTEPKSPLDTSSRGTELPTRLLGPQLTNRRCLPTQANWTRGDATPFSARAVVLRQIQVLLKNRC